jgi:hypothetical protein
MTDTTRVAAALVIVTLNPMAKIPTLVPVWEVAILQAKHGDGAITVAKEGLSIEVAEVDAALVHASLTKQYGQYGDGTKTSCVEAVYGTDKRGLKELQTAINEAIEGAKPDKSKAR